MRGALRCVHRDEYDPATKRMAWSKGGNQGGEGASDAGEWYVEGVLEELDAPGEWHYDGAARNQLFKMST